jgi:pyruvate dehydrogenase E1 component
MNELARNGQDTQRWNMLHPLEEPKLSHVEQKLAGAKGPVIAPPTTSSCSPSRSVPSSRHRTSRWAPMVSAVRIPARKLRHHFEVDRHWVTLAALKALADSGEIKREVVAAALVKYNLDPNKPNPMSV